VTPKSVKTFNGLRQAKKWKKQCIKRENNTTGTCDTSFAGYWANRL